MTELTEISVGWPLAVSLAFAATVRGWRAGRRRVALNEALHELRRPLQSVVLAVGSGAAPQVVEGSAQLAAAALQRLEWEINGGTPGGRREAIAARSLLASAVGRWQARAALAGGSLALDWRAGEVLVEGDWSALAQALDNLILNAIEHGGPSIRVQGRVEGRSLRVTVADSGRASRPPSRRESPAELVARLTGRRRHGHGLAVVRQVAAAHGGRFALRYSEDGSLAMLELPIADDRAKSAA